MYHDFYQFKETPFNVTPDPQFFFSSKCHNEAFSSLIYGIEHKKGILVTVGEVGTGKTTLCRKLMNQTNSQLKFAFIVNPNLSELELLRMIMLDLGLRSKFNSKFEMIASLNTFLLKQSRKNKTVVLVIDESQNLSVDQLEQIRLLSNLETEKEKLLQIILVGQPELDLKLQLPALRQLRQRIAVYLHLKPLEKYDIKNYIQHRIKVVLKNPKAFRDITFSERALDAIFEYTQGTPRKINMLCDRALLCGFVAETFFIDEHIIENSAKEVLIHEYSV